MLKVRTRPNTAHARAMVARLQVYEDTFTELAEREPEWSENILDHHARMRSGLTCEGLCTARAYAGKFATMRPGIIAMRPDFSDTDQNRDL